MYTLFSLNVTLFKPKINWLIPEFVQIFGSHFRIDIQHTGIYMYFVPTEARTITPAKFTNWINQAFRPRVLGWFTYWFSLFLFSSNGLTLESYSLSHSTWCNYKVLVESPRIRWIKRLVKITTLVGIDVMLTEHICIHHYNINADLKTTLLV